MSAELFWGILWAWFASFSLTTTKSFKVNPNLPLLTCYLNNSTNRGEKARILVAIGDRAFTVTLHLYIALCPITSRSSRRIKHFKMRKVDLCLSSEGTEVILATSSDEKHPPENMIDGNPETFWTTTGMFPQEFIICFHKHVRIEKLVIQSYFVRTLRIEKSTSKEPVDFEQWIERDLVHTEGQLQNEEILARDGHVTYLRFIIVSAFDHFASVHSVSAEGVAVSNLS